jgi:hypothetical protein
VRTSRTSIKAEEGEEVEGAEEGAEETATEE